MVLIHSSVIDVQELVLGSIGLELTLHREFSGQATTTLGTTPTSSMLTSPLCCSLSRAARRAVDLARSSSISLFNSSCAERVNPSHPYLMRGITTYHATFQVSLVKNGIWRRRFW